MDEKNKKTPIRSNNTLTLTWKKIFARIMHRINHKNKKGKHTQLPRKERQTLLQPNINIVLGDTMETMHKNIRLWSVNANTLLLYNELAELNELYNSLKKYNISIATLQ